jgi:hypothetical protein
VTVTPVADPIVAPDADGALSLTGAGSNGNDASFSLASAAGLTDFPTAAATFEFDLRTTDTTATLLSYTDPSNTGGAGNELWLQNLAGGLRLSMNDATVADNVTLPGIDLADGQPHHVAVTFDNATGTGAIYIDGSQAATFTPNGALTAGGMLVLGQDQDTLGGDYATGQSLTGEMDNLRVWSVARSAEQIEANAGNLADAADSDGLVYDWRMDGSGNSVANAANPAGPALTLQHASLADQSAGSFFSEDFETGAAGWSNGTTLTSTDLTTVLGRFGGGQSTQKTFAIDAGATEGRIQFTLHVLDSWDNETFNVTVNGATVASNSFRYNADSSAPGFALTSGLYRSDVPAHGPWTDQTYAVTVDLTAAQIAALPDDGHGNKLLTLGFNSTLNQEAGDESWAIDHLTLMTGAPQETFEASADTLSVDLLSGFNGGEGDLDVANLSVTASDGREVDFFVNPETGLMTADMAQFADLNATGRDVLLRVEYDVTDGVASRPATAVFRVDGSDTPTLIGASGHETALVLDSVDDTVTIPHAAGLDFGGTDPVTVEMWIKPGDKPGLQTLFDKSVGTGADSAVFRLHYVEGRLSTWNDALNQSIDTVDAPIVANEWSHVALSYDGTDVMLLVNGEAQLLRNTATMAEGTSLFYRLGANNEEPVTIGADNQPDRNFQGQIADVRIWGEGRSEMAIADGMSRPIADPAHADNLVGYYSFDGGSALDASAAGNHGQLNHGAHVDTVDGGGLGLIDADLNTGRNQLLNGVLVADTPNADVVFAEEEGPANGTLTLAADGTYSYQPNADFHGTDSFKVRLTDSQNATRVETVTIAIDANTAPAVPAHASALSLDGASYVAIDGGPELDVTSRFTMEMWIKAEGAGTLISKDALGADTTGAYNLYLSGSGASLNLGYETNNSHPNLSVADAITTGEWHHVAASFDSGTLTLYVDGNQIGSLAGVPEPSAINSDMLIGRRGWSDDPDHFRGQIDDVRMWNTARDQADIQNLMGQQLNGTEDGLVGNWTFDESAGTRVIDNTANANDGTIQGTETRENLMHISIANNEVYKGLLLGEDANQDQLSYALVSGPANGTVQLDGNSFVYDHNDGGGNDSFTVAISDGTDTVTEQIDITVG